MAEWIFIWNKAVAYSWAHTLPIAANTAPGKKPSISKRCEHSASSFPALNDRFGQHALELCSLLDRYYFYPKQMKIIRLILSLNLLIGVAMAAAQDDQQSAHQQVSFTTGKQGLARDGRLSPWSASRRTGRVDDLVVVSIRC